MGKRCAACLSWKGDPDSSGVSSLYSPDREYLLCEPCFLAEEALIDASGHNIHPSVIAAYQGRAGACSLVAHLTLNPPALQL